MFRFVIDTDQYSGNFERQMCAYITGIIGDCEVGKEEAEIAQKELGKTFDYFEDSVIHYTDEHGCFRPVKIYTTPGYFNDGRGNIIKSESTDGSNKYPAYMSVAIFFDARPDTEMLKLMCDRARKFVECGTNRTINITGFRLVQEKTELIEEKIYL